MNNELPSALADLYQSIFKDKTVLNMAYQCFKDINL